MSLRKLHFFTILAVIVGLTVVVKLNPRIKHGLPQSAGQHGSAAAIDGPLWCGRQPSRLVMNQFSVKSETPPARFVPAQSRNLNDLGVGKLLVASRDLGDPNFAQAIVLLVHQDAQGVLGLILNRRTNVPLSRVLKELKAAKDRSDPVYRGGPVDAATMLALLMSPSKIAGAEPVFGGVYLISAKSLFEQTISSRPSPAVFRVYLGYAGWSNEQLRREVELGAWFIFPGNARTVFNADPDSLWPQMIRKTELKLAGSEPANAGPRTHTRRLIKLPQGF